MTVKPKSVSSDGKKTLEIYKTLFTKLYLDFDIVNYFLKLQLSFYEICKIIMNNDFLPGLRKHLQNNSSNVQKTSKTLFKTLVYIDVVINLTSISVYDL